MAISYVNRNSAVGKAVALTSVTAGNLIACMLQWQDSNVTPTLSDGTNNPDAYSTRVVYNNQYLRLAYWLSSPKSGSVTYTWTASGGGGHTAHVYEMAATSGYTWALEHIDASATGNSQTCTSGSETSTETSMVAFGASAQYNGATYVSATIDGTAVDQYTTAHDSGYNATGSFTMRVLNNPGTYSSSITNSQPSDFTADLIGFREVASGGTTLTISVADCLDAMVLFGGP